LFAVEKAAKLISPNIDPLQGPDLNSTFSTPTVAMPAPMQTETKISPAGLGTVGGALVGVRVGGEVGGGEVGEVGGPVGGEVGGPVGGEVGGPVGGEVGGPVGGEVGGPVGGEVDITVIPKINTL
jgi:hypothetical protein